MDLLVHVILLITEGMLLQGAANAFSKNLKDLFFANIYQK